MPSQPHFAVAIGASAGGVAALLSLAAALPRDFPALVLVTQHIGAHPSLLPELLCRAGPNHSMHPHDGDVPFPGTIYVAPPDHHMLVEDGRIRLFRGPKENYCRPAIDPMFRSVALSFGPFAVGVVLTGQLDDGTAGLRAIKQCGGTAIVQDPADAEEPSMPQSALDNVEIDLRLRLAEIVPHLLRLVAVPVADHAQARAKQAVAREQGLIDKGTAMENVTALNEIAQPSTLTCPDCGGGLWELNDKKPLRWRCHTGHAFSAKSLEYAQSVAAEHSLWSGVRALHETEMLLRRAADVARTSGQSDIATLQDKRADLARDHAQALLRMIESEGRDA